MARSMFPRRSRNTWGRKSSNKRDSLFFKFGFPIITLVVLVVVLGYVSRIDRFQIKEISVSGNSGTSSIDIKEVVEKNINGLYFSIFSRKNFLLYPKGKIETELLGDFQRIEEVSLSVRSFNELHLEIAERKPDLLWCGREFPEELLEEEECFFLDSRGLIYSKAPNFSGNVFLKTYGQIAGGEPVGKNFLPVSVYKNALSLGSVLDELGLEPVILVKLLDNDMEFILESGSKVIFNLSQDIPVFSENLRAILDDTEFTERLKGPEVLEYIDLRFGNKVYFKFR